MKREVEQHLSLVLTRLEKAHGEILKTQGYNSKTEKMKLLIELVKEQAGNENSHNTTR